MPYDFPPDVDEQIRDCLNTGRYATADDVLRSALASLKSRDEEVLAIREGLKEIEAGQFSPLREVDDEIRTRKNIPRNA